MAEASTIGLDIAKQAFQAHGSDAFGNVMFRKKIVRAKVIAFFASQPRCVVAMEACGGAHYWGREIGKLGHTVRLTQLSHQTKKYDLKSKHCGAQSDLGTTRAKVVEALTEVRRAKIDGPALIFDDQLCELHSSNTDASTSASSRSMPNVLGKGSDFSTTNRHWPRNPAVFWGIPGVGCVTVGKLGLIPPVYVKPFVKRQKNDAADAEAICEAALRPSMRFVAMKNEAQQASGVVFRARDVLVRQQTQCINALRGHLTEYGYIVSRGQRMSQR